MSIRIDITAWPRTLADLEQLCHVAREQGCPDSASVGIGRDNSTVSVQMTAEDVIRVEKAEP